MTIFVKYLYISLKNFFNNIFLIYLHINNNINYLISITEFKILRINHYNRFLRYKKNIKQRVFKVGTAYLLDKIDFLTFKNQEINVLDCGANIGEIGIYLKLRQIKFNYYCFEPLIIASNCLEFNVPKSKIFNIALSNKEEEKTYYIKNDTNDSSLVKPSKYDEKINLFSKRLDTIEKIKSLKKIHLFKIDAEGHEPEVLQGAFDLFEKILYITVDCGKERNGAQTDLLVKSVLEKNFNLINLNSSRNVLLFKNKFIEK
jgi:FkbM family methyltransferase